MASAAQAAASPEQATIEQLISRWYQAKATLVAAQQEERAARDALYAAAFPNKPDKGTHRKDIGYGKELKLTAKLNHTVDRAALEVAKPHVDPELMAALIRYRPEVSETALVAITDPKVMALVSTFITTKPGSPSLEIVDAKKRG